MSIQMDRIERKWYEKGEAMQDAKSARNLRKYGMDNEEIAKILERDLTWVEELLDITKTLVTDSLTGILKGADDFDDDREELYRCLREGLEDQENGRTRPLEEAIEDMRNRRKAPSGEFAEQILKELIDEGYSGYELLDEFRIRQAKVRPAVEAMLEEAKNVANGNGEYMTHEEFVKEVMSVDDEEDNCSLSEEKDIAGYERFYKKGFQIGKVLTLSSCVQDGYISLEKAAELSEMSVEEFLQKAEEYESTYGETMRKRTEA